MNLFFLSFFLQLINAYFSLTITNTYLYQDLFSTSTTAFASEVSAWTPSGSTSPYYSLCNSIPMLGGYAIGGTFSRTYNSLPTHSALLLSMSIYILDDWVQGDSLTINLGGYSVTLKNIGRSGSNSPYSSNLCGNPSYNDLGLIKVRAQLIHNSASISISFSNSLQYGNTRESWGIRDLSIRLLTSTSGVFNSGCFVPPTGITSSNMCTCNSFSQYNSGGCMSCSAICSGCVTSATRCLYCAPNHYFTGSTCATCPSNCVSCSSSTVCTQCSSGYYLLSNGACSATCTSPMTISSSPVNSCVSACTSGQFLYWDGSCASSCASPLTTTTIGNDKLCLYGCTVAQYLYWDGSCSSTCPSPYTITTIASRNLCTFPCTAPTSFLYTNKSCLATCQTPFYQTTYLSKTICNNPCSSELYYYQNASCKATCPSPYTSLNISSVLYCNRPCTTGAYYYQNSTCLPSCPSPFTSVNLYSVLYCNSPCPSGTFYYPDSTCQATCHPPHTSYSLGVLTYCFTSCPISKYLYDNTSCLDTCPTPFTSSVSGGNTHCRCPIATPYYLQQENICNQSCDSSSYQVVTEGTMKICLVSCMGYLYSNSSCLSTCETPFTIRTVGAVSHCDFPCPAGQYYFYQDSCVANCTGIYVSSTFGIEAYCNPPCTKSQFISDQGFCNSSCPSTLITFIDSGYKWCSNPCNNPNFPYVLRNGTCVDTCESPWFVNSDYQYPMCDYSCNNTDYLTPTGGCSSTCNSPFTSISGMYYPYCDSPCRGSTPYIKFDTQTCTSACLPPYVVDPKSAIDQCIFMTAPETTSTKIAGATTSATSASASIRGSVGSAGGGGASAFGLVTLNRFLYYTRYLQIHYPNNLREYYIQANSTAIPSLGFAIPSDGIDFPPYQPIPQAFEGWGLSSSFITNYWQTFSTIVITLGIGFVLWILQKFFHRRKKKELAFFFEKVMYIFRWNFALIQFCTGYDSIMLYASCEFRTYSLDNYMSIISFAAAILCVVLAFFFLVLTYILAQKQYKVKKIKRIVGAEGEIASMKDIGDKDLNPLKIFMRNWQGFHILFGGYKDNTAFARGFIFFFMIRNILWILTLAILYEYPLVQICIMCTLSYTMLFMMLKNRPFVNLVSKFEIPFSEFIISYVNTNILILAIMDQVGSENTEMRNTIGSLIIYGFTVFGMNAFICMAMYFIVGFYLGYRRYKEMKSSGTLSFISLITIPFVSYGMDFDEFEAADHRPVKLTIQKDPKTKEFTIVKNRLFLPIFRLLRRKSKKIVSISTQGESPVDKSNENKLAFAKTYLSEIKARKNQIAPAPVIPQPHQPHQQHHIRTDTEGVDLLHQPEPEDFKFETIEVHRHPLRIHDNRPTDTYDQEDQFDGDHQNDFEYNDEESVEKEVRQENDRGIPIEKVATPKESQRVFLNKDLLKLPRNNFNSSFYSERVEKGSTSFREEIPGASEAGDSDESVQSERNVPHNKSTFGNAPELRTNVKSRFANDSNFSFSVQKNPETKVINVLIRKKKGAEDVASEVSSHRGATDINLIEDF